LPPKESDRINRIDRIDRIKDSDAFKVRAKGGEGLTGASKKEFNVIYRVIGMRNATKTGYNGRRYSQAQEH
jgi:hypothetical protein